MEVCIVRICQLRVISGAKMGYQKSVASREVQVYLDGRPKHRPTPVFVSSAEAETLQKR